MAPLKKNSTVEAVKNAISTVALAFSCALVGGLIFAKQTPLARDVHPALAAVILCITVVWLSVVEGGQAAIVGLSPVDRELYKDSHPTAYKCTGLADNGDKLHRYLLGRQFLVVLIVFTINLSGHPIEDATLWGLPKWVISVFVSSGLAMILLTTNLGQLNSEVNASYCMLDYLNTKSNYITVIISRLVEASGIVHASYLIQIIVCALAGKPVETEAAPRTDVQNIFFFGRCFMSLGILIFAFYVTLVALFNGQTTMWEGVPNGVAVVVFFILICVVGMLEAIQIAFFAVAKLPEDERGDSWIAKQVCGILFYAEAKNLAGFMIGRQLSVVSCMFFIARVTSLDIEPDSGDTLLGVSPGTQAFFNMGLLGALITTIVASIGWRLVAAAFPLAFIKNPFTYILLRWCLFLEGTGMCNASYVIAWVHKKVAGFQVDEVYIGTAEERRAKDHADSASVVSIGAGPITKFPEELKNLIATNSEVKAYMSSLEKKAGSDTSPEDV
jgi:Silicon transporter